MQNKVELIGHFGDDLTHACSAWSSTGREISPEKKDRVDKMIMTLMLNGHHTPFEKSFLHFLVTVDNATHIHLLKHRIGVSINAESARYKEYVEDKFYIPEDWPEYIRADYEERFKEQFEEYHKLTGHLSSYYESVGLLPTDARKRAKESSRYILPQGLQLKLDISFNWRSFMHFQKLRNSKHAQKEVRELAQEMLRLVEETGQWPHTISAFKQWILV